jgi:hypothetical protein
MKRCVYLLVAAATLCASIAVSGRLLVCNDLLPSDVILVAGGDDRSYWRALSLLRAGYGRDMVLNLDANEYSDEDRLAGEFIASTAPDLKAHIRLLGDEDVAVCLSKLHARSVLIVAPENESRLLRVKYHREIPTLQWHVVAVEYPHSFGTNWWQRRAWAKRFVWSVCAWLRLAIG